MKILRYYIGRLQSVVTGYALWRDKGIMIQANISILEELRDLKKELQDSL